MAAARVARDAHRRAARPPAPGVAPARSPTRLPSHSSVARNPWRRYQATVAFVTDVTYGDEEDAEIAINRVRSVHNTVRGVASRARAYSANDPDLLAYVHATLVDSALRAAAVYGPRSRPARARPVRRGDGEGRAAARCRRSATRRGVGRGGPRTPGRRARRDAGVAIWRGC